jgi:hypothetical protein
MMPSWVDYDNDGDPDLYATCFHDQSRLFRNDSGNFVDLTPAAVTPTGLGQGWGDYDNDGDLDLYLARWGTANQLVRNDGGGVFVDVTTGPLGSTENAGAAIWGDYDKDGDLDLYVANGTGGLLIRNDNVTGNHWLQVDLRGILSNAAGIGARVKVTAGGKIMIREVSGGASYQGQPALRAEFGLGPITNVTVKILWPSGIEQTLSGIAADQCVTVVEDIAIPVQLLEFSATRVGDIAEVHWRIAELGEDPVFQVFRQSQGGDRERISDEPMSGSLDYRFVDRSPPPGRVAYWLHEMSRSGRIGPRPGVRRSRTLGGDAPG